MVKKILVVDDEYAIRVLLKNFLEGNDFEVRLAEDGDTAYQTFQDFQPQLIITDIMMPMENGISIVSRIRSTHPAVKVIYLSAWLDEAETEKKLHQELNIHPHYKMIQKPFNLDTLLQTIQNMPDPA
jgi:DNA-binding response OmpR family regulator